MLYKKKKKKRRCVISGFLYGKAVKNLVYGTADRILLHPDGWRSLEDPGNTFITAVSVFSIIRYSFFLKIKWLVTQIQ